MSIEWALSPNIAYLFLVGGFLLAIMAIFSPGTGMLELTAFVALLVAGWHIYQLPFNVWALVLLLLGVIPFLLAVRKSRQLIYLVVAVAAFVLGSAYLFRGSQWWLPGVNPFLALVVSVMAGGFIWIATVKVMESDRARPAHSLETLLGAVGEAKTVIYTEGSVQVERELWSARSEKRIPAGRKVRILRREGFILDVEEISEKE
ncbi:MAG TPA: NfeD family protein [Anaerolineales bacterium]|nr:NfeD family protein [Anaerolineales bacterium]